MICMVIGSIETLVIKILLIGKRFVKQKVCFEKERNVALQLQYH